MQDDLAAGNQPEAHFKADRRARVQAEEILEQVVLAFVALERADEAVGDAERRAHGRQPQRRRQIDQGEIRLRHVQNGIVVLGVERRGEQHDGDSKRESGRCANHGCSFWAMHYAKQVPQPVWCGPPGLARLCALRQA